MMLARDRKLPAKDFQEEGVARSTEAPRQGGQRKLDMSKKMWRANMSLVN